MLLAENGVPTMGTFPAVLGAPSNRQPRRRKLRRPDRQLGYPRFEFYKVCRN